MGQPRLVPRGFCGGGAFDGSGNGTGLDLDLDLGAQEGLRLTINASTMPQTLQIGEPPATLDQSAYLGGEVPVGMVWFRHRRRLVRQDTSPVLASLEGTVTVRRLDVTSIDCTADLCEKGTGTLELTFDNVRWNSPTGVVAFAGRISVAASTDGDEGCTRDPGVLESASACPPGSACNQGNRTRGYIAPACGPTNATGADLGQVCGSPDMCKSNYCESSTGQCTLFCYVDADCVEGMSCAQIAKEDREAAGVYFKFARACIRSCQTDADCAALRSGSVCVAHGSADNTKLIGGCGGARGTTTFGKEPTALNGCDTDLKIEDFRLGTCTRLCLTNADCAAPLPSCVPLELVTNQTTTGRATVKVCQAGL